MTFTMRKMTVNSLSTPVKLCGNNQTGTPWEKIGGKGKSELGFALTYSIFFFLSNKSWLISKIHSMHIYMCRYNQTTVTFFPLFFLFFCNQTTMRQFLGSVRNILFCIYFLTKWLLPFSKDVTVKTRYKQFFLKLFQKDYILKIFFIQTKAAWLFQHL